MLGHGSFILFVLTVAGSVAAFDVAARRVPNWIIIIAVGFGILFNSLRGFSQFAAGFYGLVLGIGIAFLPFALGWLGAGDAKFLGAMGMLLGSHAMLDLLFYTALLGALLGLVSMIHKRHPDLKTLSKTWHDAKGLVLSRGRVAPDGVGIKIQNGATAIPYGLAIALGVVSTLYLSPETVWPIP